MQLQIKLLQFTVFIAAIIPLYAGVSGIIYGTEFLGKMTNPNLDSHFRYFSGLLFGIGIYFWSIIPKIDKPTNVILVLASIIFIGGLARLYSALFLFEPNNQIIFALIMELVITPLICLWQKKISSL